MIFKVINIFKFSKGNSIFFFYEYVTYVCKEIERVRDENEMSSDLRINICWL